MLSTSKWRKAWVDFLWALMQLILKFGEAFGGGNKRIVGSLWFACFTFFNSGRRASILQTIVFHDALAVLENTDCQILTKMLCERE